MYRSNYTAVKLLSSTLDLHVAYIQAWKAWWKNNTFSKISNICPQYMWFRDSLWFEQRKIWSTNFGCFFCNTFSYRECCIKPINRSLNWVNLETHFSNQFDALSPSLYVNHKNCTAKPVEWFNPKAVLLKYKRRCKQQVCKYLPTAHIM